MKVTYNWLKDFVDIRLKPSDLAHRLTMAGLEVTALEEKGDDTVFEIEVTPNRPDCLSIIGIAREVAAITGKKLKVPAIKLSKNIARDYKIKNIHIENKSDCTIYSAKPILDIKIKAAPPQIKKRLQLLGLRSVNNIVDITNYCLLETGQPPHAFDMDKIKGNAIIIRRAKPKEKIITIDGTERILTPDILIIADSSGPIAIAGIMGGLASEVTEGTKNILIENAYFNPLLIRRASRILGLSSESSYRFERQVDPEGVLISSERVAQLILKEMPASPQPTIKKNYFTAKINKIDLDIFKSNRILNTDLTAMEAKKILINLGLKVFVSHRDKLKVQIPTFRADLKAEEDLIEEISRIYGYERIRLTLPRVRPHILEKNILADIQDAAYSKLINLGLSETISYSLIGERLFSKLKLSFDAKDIIKVVNPLSTDQAILRPTLLAGLLNSTVYNLNRKCETAAIFEMGKIFLKSERLNLGIALVGTHHNDWLRKKDILTIFDLKGIIERLFDKLGIKDWYVQDAAIETFVKSAAFQIKIKDKTVGIMGSFSSNCLEAWDIAESDMFGAEIFLEDLAPFVNLEKTFKPVAQFPSVKRDISLILNEEISTSSVLGIIRQKASHYIKNIEVFDYYVGKQIPQGQKSLSFSLEYGLDTRTLTDEEVNKIHTDICQAIKDILRAEIR